MSTPRLPNGDFVRYYEDGETHINVYSRGATPLGRWLSNFAHTPFTVPEDGKFESIEGYWYWLSTKDDRLRHLYGFAAKQLGRQLRGQDWNEDPQFKNKIILAIHAKLRQHPYIVAVLNQSTLPLYHYYVSNGKIQDMTEKTRWMLDIFDEVRSA